MTENQKKFEAFTMEAKKFNKPGGLGLRFVRSWPSDDKMFFVFAFTGKILDSLAYRSKREEKELVSLEVTVNSGYGVDLSGFRKWVLRTLRLAWMHEFEELMTYDDHLIYDPHPDGTSALAEGKVIMDNFI